MRIIRFLLAVIMLACGSEALCAEDFYLDSPYNKRTLRFEIDNDAVWDEDSNFSRGRYSTSDNPGCWKNLGR